MKRLVSTIDSCQQDSPVAEGRSARILDEVRYPFGPVLRRRVPCPILRPVLSLENCTRLRSRGTFVQLRRRLGPPPLRLHSAPSSSRDHRSQSGHANSRLARTN